MNSMRRCPIHAGRAYDAAMDAPGFVGVCLVGVTTVFVLLGALALVFRVIALVFPVRAESGDAAVLAAVTAAAQRAYPGTRVTTGGGGTMIRTEKPKQIRVMMTAFRDGSAERVRRQGPVGRFPGGGEALRPPGHPPLRVRRRGPLPGTLFLSRARIPSPTCRAIRDAVGPDADLQILTRSVSGVTLTTQSLEALRLQARS